MFRRGNPFVRAGGNFFHMQGKPSVCRAFPILAFTCSHSTKLVEILSVGGNVFLAVWLACTQWALLQHIETR